MSSQVPVIAIIGRPNVGKSTLFNVLTKSNDALVYDQPGVTRDRIFGDGVFGKEDHNIDYIVVDTGGINLDEQGIDASMAQQSLKAAQDSDIILWLVDTRDGLTAVDYDIADKLRKLKQFKDKKIYIVANKIDGLNLDLALSDFYSLGMGEPIPIAAAHKRGVYSLVEHIFTDYLKSQDLNINQDINNEDSELAANIQDNCKIAIIGRPNVGKSTLINRLLGEERVVVYDQPGTTRDSVYIPFKRIDLNTEEAKQYIFIDTAGVRKRGKVNDVVEKFSVIKTLKAIRDADVVILLIDSSEKLAEQDMHLLSYTKQQGKSLIIACNKWDGLENEHKEYIKSELDRKLSFVNYAKKFYISAKHGTNVGNLWGCINKCFASNNLQINTSDITDLLEQAVAGHQPPLVNGRRIKLRYAHIGNNSPLRIVIHGKQTNSLPEHYKKYLANFFEDKLKLYGTPVLLNFKTDDNPYKDIRNTLTPRQYYKRQRVIKHRIKSKKK